MLGFVVAVVLLNHLHSDFFFMLISKDSNIFLKKNHLKREVERERSSMILGIWSMYGAHSGLRR